MGTDVQPCIQLESNKSRLQLVPILWLPYLSGKLCKKKGTKNYSRQCCLLGEEAKHRYFQTKMASHTKRTELSARSWVKQRIRLQFHAAKEPVKSQDSQNNGRIMPRPRIHQSWCRERNRASSTKFLITWPLWRDLPEELLRPQRYFMITSVLEPCKFTVQPRIHARKTPNSKTARSVSHNSSKC